ncbi:hypothetical protein [Deinococcus sp. QL22]|uniref:RCC1 domain-containing protein n=1 Tax=Deinococcus sp. QL22 TaxID=2939437 RepID=UPI002017ACEE|nr:hypothetical protein [Deinococcus sp. QL22]UQN09270.1 hypothetical protein M1R55_22100 [Deinococcus sp. QL22]
MKTPTLFLVTGMLTLTACGSTPSVAAPPVGLVPVVTSPSQGEPRLGMVEIEFNGGGDQPLNAKAVQRLAAQTLTDRTCVVVGSALSRSSADLAGKRYLQATFPVTNTCSTDLQNLTFVAVRRFGGTATLDGSAITSMKTFGGTDAAVGLASQILPTQPVYLSIDTLSVDQKAANLQVFDDTAGGELDALQAQVDASGTSYDLLPYGFVATSGGGRVIPAGGTGKVTFAVSLPLQADAAQDVFRFGLLVSLATNTITSVTQGLEEQDAAGKAAVEARAAALPGAEIHTLLGPAITPATSATNGVPVCQVRTAGSRSAPTTTLVNAQVSFSGSAPKLPSILGGAHLQPRAAFIFNGMVFPRPATWTSRTPETLGVTNNLVHPVTSFPLQRQTGTVQGSIRVYCQTDTLPPLTIPLRTSPFMSLDAGRSYSVALQADGTVTAWGKNDAGQTSVPAGLSGVVAVSAGGDHTLALQADGTVIAWGKNEWGQTDVPAGLSGVVAVAAGRYHSVALKADGTVVAWGFPLDGQTDVPAGLSDVVAVAAGYRHSMALKADGTVISWGEYYSFVPAGLKGVVAIAAGDDHSMALKADGTVVAWGSNANGQTSVPTRLRGVAAIAADSDHSMVLISDETIADGSVDGWGRGSAAADLFFLRRGVAISSGTDHDLVLQADGTVGASGRNIYGQTTVPAGLKVLLP